MSFFENSVVWLSKILDKIAGWSLVGMMLLTVADVILRSFRKPILGTYEIVGLLGALVIAFAMPHTMLQRGHVAVEILVSRLSPPARSLINLITRILSTFLFALIAWVCIQYGNELRTAGEVSMTLRLPFYPVLYAIALAAGVVCLVVVSTLVRSMAKRREERVPGNGSGTEKARGARK
jgi:TRAP-type C4-dicarboxylate transport system permease small subunit